MAAQIPSEAEQLPSAKQSAAPKPAASQSGSSDRKDRDEGERARELQRQNGGR